MTQRTLILHWLMEVCTFGKMQVNVRAALTNYVNKL